LKALLLLVAFSNSSLGASFFSEFFLFDSLNFFEEPSSSVTTDVFG